LKPGIRRRSAFLKENDESISKKVGNRTKDSHQRTEGIFCFEGGEREKREVG